MNIRQILGPARSSAVMAGVLCLCALAPVASSAQSRSYVDFEPLNLVPVTAGKTTPVEFTFHIKSGFHINSSKPLTPELIPTSLGFSPPPDIIIAKVQYPAGQLTSFPFDPTEKLSVYSGDVIVKAVIIAQPNAPKGDFTVHGEFKYQACDNNSCYPPKKLPVQFDVKVVPASAKPTARPNAQSPHIHN
jgi:hypothetical protein